MQWQISLIAGASISSARRSVQAAAAASDQPGDTAHAPTHGKRSLAAGTASAQNAASGAGTPAAVNPLSVEASRPKAAKLPSAAPSYAAAAPEIAAAETAAGTDSKVSSQAKRQQTAKAYLGKLQGALPAAAYQQLMTCLQQYRKDHDTLRVTDGVLELLRMPSRRHLLLDFATFLRSQDRDWFLRCVK